MIYVRGIEGQASARETRRTRHVSKWINADPKSPIGSCFPILPRLYQHVASVTPYNSGTSGKAIQDHRTKTSVSAAAKQGSHWGNKGRENGGNWIHLDDRNIPGIPARTTVDVEQRTKDDDAMEEAVEGKEVDLAGDDVEKGRR